SRSAKQQSRTWSRWSRQSCKLRQRGCMSGCTRIVRKSAAAGSRRVLHDRHDGHHALHPAVLPDPVVRGVDQEIRVLAAERPRIPSHSTSLSCSSSSSRTNAESIHPPPLAFALLPHVHLLGG